MACSVTLPYLTGRVIDDVVRGGDRASLAPLLWLVVAIVVVRMGFAVVRRWVSGQVSLAVEYDLRQRLFAHLQRMSLSYYDRMPVGQLMSRATSDLQTVRFFLGYGLIFLFMQAFTLVIVTVILLVMNWSLALLALLMGPGLALVAWRYSRRSNPVLIDVQQRVALVTEMAEESAVGIRVIKAFGREGDRTTRFGATARGAFDRSMDAAHLRALYQPLMGFIPVLGLGVVLIYGGLLTIDGSMTLGEFVAFYLYLTLLMAPFRSLGLLVGQAQRAIAGGTRIFEVLDTEPDIVEPPRALPLPAGGGAPAHGGRHVRLRPRRGAGAPRHRPRRARRPHHRADRADRLGQDHPHPAGPALLRPHRGPRAARRRRRAGRAPRRAAPARSGMVLAGPLPVLHHRAREHRLRPPRRDRGRGRAGGRGWRAPTASSRRCRTATTPWSASGA